MNGHETTDAAQRRRLEAVVPMIAGHFRRARTDMPAPLRAAFQANGLGNRHGAVLAQVLAAESISVSDLARELDIGLTNASQLAGDLTRAGWLERRNDPDDHRRVVLTVSADKRAGVAEFVDRRAAPLLRAMARLTPTQRDGFLAGLEAWAQEIPE
jgi:DNA-binding MarR family transcriptional regulator